MTSVTAQIDRIYSVNTESQPGPLSIAQEMIRRWVQGIMSRVHHASHQSRQVAQWVSGYTPEEIKAHQAVARAFWWVPPQPGIHPEYLEAVN